MHVFAIDYRGFGISGGYPTEEGLITDGVTLLNFLTSGSPYSISPSKIVLVGQSLGTAVTAAVAERFAFGVGKATIVAQPVPFMANWMIAEKKEKRGKKEILPEPFAGIVLVAPFSSVPKLIDSYSLGGLTPPILSPLVGYPRAQKYLRESIVDKWDTAGRVARLTGLNTNMSSLYDIDGEQALQATEAVKRYESKPLDLTIIHARNDVEIPWREGRRVWFAATGQTDGGSLVEENHSAASNGSGRVLFERTVGNGFSEVKVWEKPVSDGLGRNRRVKKVRWEKVGYGGQFSCDIYVRISYHCLDDMWENFLANNL